MKLTNKTGLPQSIMDAVQSFDRDYKASHTKESDISVTQLIDSPRKVELQRQHWEDIEEDVSDRIFALLGHTVHNILERADTSALTEERLYLDVQGWTLSGMFDRVVVDNNTLQDYKVCSVWEIIYGLKKEREHQLNCLAYMANQHGYKIKKLQVVAILRDWSQSKTERDAGYPQQQVAVIDVPMWSEADQLKYIQERIVLHQEARDGYDFLCNEEERWHKPDKWCVMKVGRKSAVRLLDTEEEAQDFIITKGLSDDMRKYSIEHRPGQDTRCEHYCPVADYCEQYQKTKEAA